MGKEVYVIAGPNGAGKTQFITQLVPKEVPIVNGDLIHREMFGTVDVNIVSEADAKAEAIARITKYTKEGKFFGFESNMARSEDWKYLKGLQQEGYKINVIFVSVDKVSTLNLRITLRYESGEAHYVTPTIVEGRYNAGLKLLDHFFNVPDKLTVIDNSVYSNHVLSAEKGNIVFKSEPLPTWVEENLASRLHPDEGPKNREAREMSSRDEVLARYKEMQGAAQKKDLPDLNEEDNDEPEKKIKRGPRL